MSKSSIEKQKTNYIITKLKERVDNGFLIAFFANAIKMTGFSAFKDLQNSNCNLYKEIKNGFKNVSLLTKFVTATKKGKTSMDDKALGDIVSKILDAPETDMPEAKDCLLGCNLFFERKDDFYNVIKYTDSPHSFEDYKVYLGENYEKIISKIIDIFKKDLINDEIDTFVRVFGMPDEAKEELLKRNNESNNEEEPEQAPTIVDNVQAEKTHKDKSKSEAQLKKEVSKQKTRADKLEKELEDLKKQSKSTINEYEKKTKELEKQVAKLQSESLNGQESKYKKEYKKLLKENEELNNRLGDFEFRSEEWNKEKVSLNDYINELQNKIGEATPISIGESDVDEKDFLKNLALALKSQSLSYKQEDLLNFHIACKSSMLNILAGPSGTGKTRLPLIYAEAINCKEEDGTLLFLPVSPSFTEPSDVLGYYSAQDNKYHPSETGLTEFLINAMNNKKKKMYMVIFDEMNLSQIEYWFAPFLSVLEKPEGQRFIRLYSSFVSPENKDDFPEVISINDNVLFIGTINLDETTKDLSDRLIDRSIIINLDKPTFNEHWYAVNDKAQNTYTLKSKMNYSGFNHMRVKFPNPYSSVLYQEEIDFFDKLHEEIQKINPTKGVSFRNIKKICYYLAQAEALCDETYNREFFFDLIFKQTILKKINGYDDSIKALLGKIDESDNIVDSILIKVFDNNPDVSTFTYSRKEIKNKIKEYKNYGFTR